MHERALTDLWEDWVTEMMWRIQHGEETFDFDDYIRMISE